MALKKPAKSPKLDSTEEDAAAGEEQRQGEEPQQTLEKVVCIQNEIDRLNEQASEEILHVEQKYNKLRKPHFERRSELIKNLPDFWMSTLIENTQFSEYLSEDDETVLQYLENLTVDEFEDVKSGYKINFHFRPNPYFENKVLSKEYILDSSGESTIVGTTIQWKPGMDLTDRQPTEVKGGRKRPHEDALSFFLWFKDTDTSTADDLGEVIKDDIWPNPLQYYLGGEPSVDAGEEEVGDEEEDGDEEDEEGLEDDDDDEADPDEIVDLSDEDEDELDDEG